MIGDDPLFKAFNTLRKSIQILIDEKCFAQAVILIYCGIDALAHLGRDRKKASGNATDFKSWVDRYFIMQGQTKISSEEWWQARNAALHTLGGESKAHIEKSTRTLSYMIESSSPIMYNPRENATLIMVDILEMQKAFENGKNESMMQMYANNELRDVLDERAKKLFIVTQLRE